ncbi:MULTISPECIES: M14 family metallopeptidase [Pseudomonadati]|uniref:M14 family metallocarboxypeptidase n=1 Tax=Shewanella aestuarii TaxID=1028752 RepID=A0ABT0L0S8_9GAMM|nr:M14 family metallocarboxypeptidase [Shewanella aestuarii]MCL1117326.1 M14 family metallocarboxypeptidase [Shewanella aestuarii]GGN74686.1 N-acetyl-L-ornithine deacetylase ArgE [Shewanella aestuarii]
MTQLFKNYLWHSELFNCQSNDLTQFEQYLSAQVTRLNMQVKPLGFIDDHQQYPLSLYQTVHVNPDNPSILVCAGFHGEESAGPWGLISALTQLDPRILEKINLSILPLVNPSGFSIGNRLNLFQQNPNRGFVYQSGQVVSNSHTSVEGLILQQSMARLLTASEHGILTCHEDVLLHDTYLYALESHALPSPLSYQLRDSLGRYFPIADDGEIDECPVKEGIIFNHFDSSFESALFQSGSQIAICTETPGQQAFDQRVLANRDAISLFINHFVNNHRQ